MGAEVLQMPTANQIPLEDKLLPPNGAYVSRIHYKDETYYGISNVGEANDRRKETYGVETYILDFHKNIYHKEIEVELLCFKRPEMKFDSLESLSQQMHEDAEFARRYAKEYYGYEA